MQGNHPISELRLPDGTVVGRTNISRHYHRGSWRLGGLSFGCYELLPKFQDLSPDVWLDMGNEISEADYRALNSRCF
jgi:hypothetical protein